MPAAAGWIAAALCALLAGCGTDVKDLLEAEGRLWSVTDAILVAAEDLDQGLEEPVYDAESEKQQACEEVNSALGERLYATDVSFSKQFWSDLVRLYVFVVPVGSVEACAAAHERYRRELFALCRDLEQRGAYAGCPT